MKGKTLTKLLPKTGAGITVKTAQQKKEKRTEALEHMLDMMLSVNDEEFRLNHQVFKTWSLNNEAEWQLKSVYVYFEGFYLEKREYWHLKEVYRVRIKKQRVDVLVYLLWDVVIPDFMQHHLKYTVGISSRRLNNAEWARQERANAYDDDEAEALILEEQVGSIKVSSFTIEDKTYLLQINARINTLVSYPCNDFTLNKAACKHIYLVNRVKSIVVPEKDAHLPMIAFANRREEQEDEVATIISDEERLNVFNNGLNDANQVIQELSTYASTELHSNNYGVLAGLQISRWARDLRQIFNDMKAYRNNPMGSNRQNRFN